MVLLLFGAQLGELYDAPLDEELPYADAPVGVDVMVLAGARAEEPSDGLLDEEPPNVGTPAGLEAAL